MLSHSRRREWWYAPDEVVGRQHDQDSLRPADPMSPADPGSPAPPGESSRGDAKGFDPRLAGAYGLTFFEAHEWHFSGPGHAPFRCFCWSADFLDQLFERCLEPAGFARKSPSTRALLILSGPGLDERDLTVLRDATRLCGAGSL